MTESPCDCAEPNYCRHHMHVVHSTASSRRLVNRRSDCLFFLIIDLDAVSVGRRTANRVVEKIPGWSGMEELS